MFLFEQESVRKELERLFGIVQSRFEIILLENRSWDLFATIIVSNCCIIMPDILVRIPQHIVETGQEIKVLDVGNFMEREEIRMEK